MHIVEATNIQQTPQGISGETPQKDSVTLNKNTLVSMNCWSFHPKIFSTLAELIHQTLVASDNTIECYLPDAAMCSIQQDSQSVEVLTSHDAWFGVTYAADSNSVNNKLAILTEKGLFH